MGVSIQFGTLAYNAFRRAGILKEAGRGIGASETSDALSAANSFIDFIKIHRMTVLAEDRQLFPVTSGQQTYRIGLDNAADWYAPAPSGITSAGYVFTNVDPPVEQAFEILTPQLWKALSPKTLQSSVPYMLYYERFTNPNAVSGTYGKVSQMGAVSLYPVPLDSTISVALYLWVQLEQVPTSTTTLVLPDGAQELLESNLAVRLAAMFPKRAALSPYTAQMARESLSRYKNMNSVVYQSRGESGAMGGNEHTGTFNLISNGYNSPWP